MLSMWYHENSKLDRLDIIRQGEMIGAFSSPYLLKRASQPYKCFTGSRIYPMSEYGNTPLPQKGLFASMQNRRSIRTYNSLPISMFELYLLLHHAYGITAENQINGADGTWAYRSVPSGGALYPLELYVYLHRSPLPQGIYHYRPDINALEAIANGDHMPILKQNMVAEPYINIDTANCIVLISSIMERTLLKYGERGYRFILQEVGFVGQNISLTCEALDMASCMIGSFFDNEINKLIDADGVTETTQAVIALGKKTITT